MSEEKREVSEIENVTQSHIQEQHLGHGTDIILLDAGAANLEKGQYQNLKLAEDGHTVLVPQPSSDPNDPLNWSWTRKHVVLMLCSFSAFLGDYGAGAGIPLVVLQGQEWGQSPTKVVESTNISVVMLGVGGLFWIVIASWWGRAPVLFWSTLSGTLFTLACAVTDSFPVYYGFRALMGFTLTAYQVIGLSCITDMFFLHEHARKIGIWVSAFLIAPYLAPCLGNFMVSGTGKWRGVMWLVFAMGCLDVALILIFADETYYERRIPLDQQPHRPQTLMGRLSRVVGVWQIQHHSGYFTTFSTSCKRLLLAFSKPIVFISMAYFALNFMWNVGINVSSSILLETPVEAGGYGFGPRAIGYLYFAPMVATIIGEFFGHFFNDFIANRYVQKHDGIFKPEARLLGNYLAAVFMVPGLIIVGQTLENHLSYAGIIMGWGMFSFGGMLAIVATTAYLVDSYGNAGAEVSGLLNFARVVSGFSVGYFQQPWGERVGFGISFATQAIIAATSVLFIVLLQIYGSKIRARAGPVV